MATPIAQLTVTVSGKAEYLGVRSLQETLRDTLTVLCEVDRGVSSVEDGSLEWEIVNASTSSPLTIGFRSRPTVAVDYSEQVIEAYLDGLDSLNTTQAAPRYFTPVALKASKDLADHLGNGIAKVVFSTPQRRVDISTRMASNVSHLIEQPEAEATQPARGDHHETGALEGTVETLTSHGKFYFNLYDALTHERVRCTFDEVLSEQVRSAWRKRVTVEGRILYGADGRIKSIEVASIRLKPNRDSLPQFKDFGIDITGGIESSLYVRGLRDDD